MTALPSIRAGECILITRWELPASPNHPPSSLPGRTSSAVVRQEAVGLGVVKSVVLHTSYHRQYGQSLPWIISINEQKIRSVQVFSASQKVMEDIKADGSYVGTNKLKYWQLISDPSLMLPGPDSSSHLKPPASTKTEPSKAHMAIAQYSHWDLLVWSSYLNPHFQFIISIFWLIKWQTLENHRKGMGSIVAGTCRSPRKVFK